MTRAGSTSLAAGLLIAALATSPAALAQPPVLRLDASGLMPAANSPPCEQSVRAVPGMLQRWGSHVGGKVDPCGRMHLDDGLSLQSITVPLADAASLSNARIDSMMVYATIFGYGETYSPGGSIRLMAHAEQYYLDNGTSWYSGAGSAYPTAATLDHVEVSGDTIRYVLRPPAEGRLYEQTDYDSGDHSSQGRIDVEGPLVIVALTGSTQGMLVGKGRLVSNDATWYGEPRFNYYSAPVGSLVPFRMRYQLQGGTFTAGLFNGTFYYTGTGAVDFKHAVRPPLQALEIKGPSRIPDQVTMDYHAIARYEGGTLVDVSDQAVWSVAPGDVASIAAGRLTVGAVTGSVTLALHASYSEDGVSLDADAQVVARHDFYASDHAAWPMYQVDARHTGFLPVTPNLSRFQLLWQRNLGVALNPVAAADNRLFATGITYFSSNSPITALDARTGATLWSYNFGQVFSVNPPSTAYGNVYVQSGNHSQDTWLHCFDAATGARVFKSAHQAQWERYFAPTILDGKVYVNGGSYGGMYAFDALTGGQNWFAPLPQYDQWTPAVGQDHVYAYVGEYSPGLYVARKSDGVLAFKIPDPSFDWSGWSMNLAPVLGTHDDVLAIHDGRLICFDLLSRGIRWERASNWLGQPSLANDVLYAIDGGTLVALNELTGAPIWSWTPPFDQLQGALIVTASLAFVSSANRVYAVSLDGHNSIWSEAVGGHLSIANGALYVAGSNGQLTAFDIGIGPPLVAHAGADVTMECAAATGGTHATLDGSTSEGPDLAFEWTASGVTFDDPHAVKPTGTFPLGANEVVLTVSRDGNLDRDTVVVTVTDTQNPSLALVFDPPLLWPPSHELVHVRVTATPSDACDEAPTFKLLSVTSSEPDGGSGDPFPDDILDVSQGQPDLDVWVRAQREPGGPGRTYTFCYEVADDVGHAVRQCADLVVPASVGRAQLHSGATPRLTVFGAPGLMVGHIDESSIVVKNWSEELWRVVAGSGANRDLDLDGRMDRNWELAPIAGPLSPKADVEPSHLQVHWRVANEDYYASLQGSAVTAVGGAPSVLSVGLAANPDARSARLVYDLPASGNTRLTIHDVAGRLVARLVDGWNEGGHHEVAFHPARSAGALLFYRLEWQGQRAHGKFVLLN